MVAPNIFIPNPAVPPPLPLVFSSGYHFTCTEQKGQIRVGLAAHSTTIFSEYVIILAPRILRWAHIFLENLLRDVRCREGMQSALVLTSDHDSTDSDVKSVTSREVFGLTSTPALVLNKVHKLN
jgi:hypothetical protein